MTGGIIGDLLTIEEQGPRNTWSRMSACGVNVKHFKRFRFPGRTGKPTVFAVAKR
jgi:hypothetical protein